MEKRKRGNGSNFIVQGSILAIAGIIVRLIGIAYRIPLTNIIGNEGNGYYALAFEVYAMLLLLSSYSLPLAVSKLVAARVARGERKNAYRIFKGAMLFAFISGSIMMFIAFFGSDYITGSLMKQPLGSFALQALAPTVLIVAVMGVLRGYFQGLGTMMPTAVSQIVEGILNAVVSVGAAYYLFSYGSKIDVITKSESYAEAYGAAGGTLGTGVGALFGLLFLIFVFLGYQKVFSKKMKRDRSSHEESYSEVYRILFLTIGPIILSTAVYNISGILDQGMFNHILASQDYLAKDMSSLWGIYSSKYKLLINVPIAIASALTASIIPSLTAAMVERDRDGTKRKVDTAIRFTMFIAIPSAAGLMALASPILMLLFRDTNPLPARLLVVGSASVIFYSLSTLSNGILQGINRMRLPVRHAFISLILHLALLFILLYTFKLHVYGVVYANMFFAFMMCVLNGISIHKHLGYTQEVKKTFIIPLVASAMMGISAFLIHKGIEKLTGSNTIAVLAAILIAALLYCVLLLFLKAVGEEEIQKLPKGHSLISILKKCRLI